MKKGQLKFDIYEFNELPEYWQITFIAEYCNDHRDWIYNNTEDPKEYAKKELEKSDEFLFIKNDDDFDQINLDELEYWIPLHVLINNSNLNIK